MGDGLISMSDCLFLGYAMAGSGRIYLGLMEGVHIEWFENWEHCFCCCNCYRQSTLSYQVKVMVKFDTLHVAG